MGDLDAGGRGLGVSHRPRAHAEVTALTGREVGFVPVPVDLSEFRKAGGGPTCCTLEFRGAPVATTLDLEEVFA